MKTYLYLLMAVVIGVTSCQPDDNSLTAKSNNPVLKFETNNEFEVITNQVPDMTDDELDAWEKSKGFVSYRYVLNQARREWNNVSDEPMLLAFTEKYSDILSVHEGDIVPKISIRLYQSIVNREMLYQTGTTVHKVVGNYLVSAPADNHQSLYSVTTASGASSDAGLKVLQYTGDNSAARSAAACSTDQTASYFANHGGCRDDREVYVRALSYLTYSTTYEGDWRQPRVLLKVWGKERNGWCNWNTYTTELSYRNASFTIYAWTVSGGVATSTLFTRTPPDYAPTGDRTDLPWDQAIGDKVLNFAISANAFSTLHFEGASRGTNNNFAVLDCQ